MDGVPLDPARFPRLARYLASLPRGLASYPECQAKGAVVRNWTDDLSELHHRPLPPELLALLTEPPRLSAWYPEVHLWALLQAYADVRGLSDAGFVAWSRDLNTRLLQGPVYRFVAGMLSPSTVLNLSASAFKSFHRGLGFAVAPAEPDGLTVELTFPPRLLDAFCLRGLGTAFEVVLHLGKASKATVDLQTTTETTGRFLVRWKA